jgi:hypothetical protein
VIKIATTPQASGVNCCRARRRCQDAVSHVRRHQGDRPGGAALRLQVQSAVYPTKRQWKFGGQSHAQWCSPGLCASLMQVPHGRACGHEHQVFPQDGWGMTTSSEQKVEVNGANTGLAQFRCLFCRVDTVNLVASWFQLAAICVSSSTSQQWQHLVVTAFPAVVNTITTASAVGQAHLTTQLTTAPRKNHTSKNQHTALVPH